MKISIGKSRKDTHWKVVDWSWDQLCDKLSKPIRTSESMSDYKSMSVDDKAIRKDVGGFVGGVVTNGRRVLSNIANRSVITLDADFAEVGIWDRVSLLLDYTMCCYSTHSHTPKAPRLRFILPINREVTPEEYEPIARYVANEIGINQFDITTYDLNRLMYFPSVSSDGEFLFYKTEGRPVPADEILGKYNDWHDTSEWPIGDTEVKVRSKAAKQQGDPVGKPGIVGAFCSVYDVPSAIDKFLSDVYVPCADPNRYTYTGGSTAAGVVLYQGGKFAYSHHATDPASGQLCNAFDLVRVHKFGDLDAKVEPDTPINKYPSYEAMREFATEDEEVKAYIVERQMAEAKEVFGEPIQELEWTKQLTVTKAGQIETTIGNIVTILENDPNLKDSVGINEFRGSACTRRPLPWKPEVDTINGTAWTDDDDAALRYYLEETYGITGQQKVYDALSVVMQKQAFHPVREYLDSLEWDEVPRAEGLFIDFMGAEDDIYTRTVTHKWLLGAVARIQKPGCKFDNMIVLVGAQGIGKSYLGNRLGRYWFSDTFTTVQGKEAFEQLEGAWIIEMGELSAMKRSEVETVKMFISKQTDNYRAAYARRKRERPRQCVFYGTTNNDTFLRDATGNRRFWVIGCMTEKPVRSVFSLTSYDIDQIWAEAMSWYRTGEKLYLPKDVADMAVEKQSDYEQEDPRKPEILEYLDKEVPENWDELGKKERRDYIQGFLELPPGTPLKKREFISTPEIGYELYGMSPLDTYTASDLHSILISLKGWKKQNRKRRVKEYGVLRVYKREEE